MIKKQFFIVILWIFTYGSFLCGQQDNRFSFVQVRYPGGWDPYPNIHQEIISFLMTTTSIEPHFERKVVDLDNLEIFEYPFIILLGNEQFPAITDETGKRLIQYLESGGILFIEDSLGIAGSLFDRGMRMFIKKYFSDNPLTILPRDHVIMKSFYLLRNVPGRIITRTYFEGILINGRTQLIYSQNDLCGVWMRDRMGAYVYTCVPEGEVQRREAMKMTANIIIFSVTGTYKTDAIHIPFILQKLKSYPY